MPAPTILSAKAENLTAALLNSTCETPRAVADDSPNFRMPAADDPNATFTAFRDSSRLDASLTAVFVKLVNAIPAPATRAGPMRPLIAPPKPWLNFLPAAPPAPPTPAISVAIFCWKPLATGISVT